MSATTRSKAALALGWAAALMASGGSCGCGEVLSQALLDSAASEEELDAEVIEPDGLPPMTDAAWQWAAEPGWQWVGTTMIWTQHTVSDDQFVLDAAEYIGLDRVRGLRILGDYSSRGTCFQGEEEMHRATQEHRELNTLAGGVAVNPSELELLSQVEAELASRLVELGAEPERIRTAHIADFVEVETTPRRSAFRPQVQLWILVAAAGGEDDTELEPTPEPDGRAEAGQPSSEISSTSATEPANP